MRYVNNQRADIDTVRNIIFYSLHFNKYYLRLYVNSNLTLCRCEKKVELTDYIFLLTKQQRRTNGGLPGGISQ